MIKSSFAELQVAVKGLTVSQSNMQVSTHNIANADTVGYSRQYTQQVATRPFATGRDGMWGTGATVTAVLQHRSPFLDTQYRNKSSVLGEFTLKNQQLSITEVTFNALGEGGLTTQIDDIFNTLETLSTNPESLTTRNNTITSLQTFTEQLGTIGRQLQEQQLSINQEVKSVVDNMNSLGKQIASLNNQIRLAEANGSHANDLRDQRNVLIDELSKYGNIEVTEKEKNVDYDRYNPASGPSNKQINIQINGYNFVQGDEFFEMECVQRDNTNRRNEMDAFGLYDIRFKLTGQNFDIYSPTLKGQLKGLIDTRDGNNNYQTLAYDSFLGRAVPLGAEPKMPDSADTTLYPLGAADPAYISDLAKYADVKRSNYATDADFVDAVVNKGVRGKNATRTLSTDNYKGIPHYMNKLNNFIRSFALSFNEGKTFDTTNGYGKNAVKVDVVGTEGHINSYDLNGNKGELLFTYQSGGVYQYTGEIVDYTAINFSNFHVNPNIVNDKRLLACSETIDGLPGDANAVKGYIALKKNTNIYKEGTFQDYLIAMTGELSIAKKQADKFELNYTEVVGYTDSQRMSISGVDLNEEAVNVTRNQQIYQASAKLISILNTVYDACINLGR